MAVRDLGVSHPDREPQIAHTMAAPTEIASAPRRSPIASGDSGSQSAFPHRNDPLVSGRGTMPIPIGEPMLSGRVMNVPSPPIAFHSCHASVRGTLRAPPLAGEDCNGWALLGSRNASHHVSGLPTWKPGQADEDKQKKDLVHARDLGTRGDA